MIRKLLLVVCCLSSSVVYADTPWHLQPMDTWLPGECYRSPYATSTDFGTPTDYTKPKAFKVGDTVKITRLGTSADAVTKIDGHLFEVLEVLPKYKQGYDFYRSRDTTDGRVWKLSPFEMVAVKIEGSNAPLSDNYRRNFELDDPEHDAWYEAKKAAEQSAKKTTPTKPVDLASDKKEPAAKTSPRRKITIEFSIHLD